MVVDDLGEDPDRWLVNYPDRAANLREVIVLMIAEGDELITHAMPLRAVYRNLLEPRPVASTDTPHPASRSTTTSSPRLASARRDGWCGKLAGCRRCCLTMTSG